MNRLVALVMLLTLAVICAEIVWGEYACGLDGVARSRRQRIRAPP
jgi:hypothetical protein